MIPTSPSDQENQQHNFPNGQKLPVYLPSSERKIPNQLIYRENSEILGDFAQAEAELSVYSVSQSGKEVARPQRNSRQIFAHR